MKSINCFQSNGGWANAWLPWYDDPPDCLFFALSCHQSNTRSRSNLAEFGWYDAVVVVVVCHQTQFVRFVVSMRYVKVINQRPNGMAHSIANVIHLSSVCQSINQSSINQKRPSPSSSFIFLLRRSLFLCVKLTLSFGYYYFHSIIAIIPLWWLWWWSSSSSGKHLGPRNGIGDKLEPTFCFPTFLLLTLSFYGKHLICCWLTSSRSWSFQGIAVYMHAQNITYTLEHWWGTPFTKL